MANIAKLLCIPVRAFQIARAKCKAVAKRKKKKCFAESFYKYIGEPLKKKHTHNFASQDHQLRFFVIEKKPYFSQAFQDCYLGQYIFVFQSCLSNGLFIWKNYNFLLRKNTCYFKKSPENSHWYFRRFSRNFYCLTAKLHAQVVLKVDVFPKPHTYSTIALKAINMVNKGSF